MPNTNSSDLRCTDDHGGIDCYPRDPAPPGVCVHCDLGTCSGCGAPMTPEQCATSRTECPVPARDEVYCPVCLKEVCEGPGEAASDGIPPTCGRCGGRTDGVKPAPTFGGMQLAACDCEEETVETRTLSDAELLALKREVA